MIVLLNQFVDHAAPLIQLSDFAEWTIRRILDQYSVPGCVSALTHSAIAVLTLGAI